jgi:hypothetical protein
VFNVEKVTAKVHNFRSSFSREMAKEKDAAKSGSGKRTTTVYAYTKQLNFLRSHVKVRSMTDNTTKSKAIIVVSTTKHFIATVHSILVTNMFDIC